MGTIAQDFRRTIKAGSMGEYVVREDNNGNIHLITDNAEGQISFYPQDIVELAIITAKDQENVFYLHFRLDDLDHALSLFAEMRQTLLSLKKKKRIHVLLTCTSALTSSYFASELNTAAETLRLDYEFTAISFDRIYEKGFDYDVILLAPQVHFQYDRLKQIFRDTIVMKIPTGVFATYQTGKMLRMLQDAVLPADRIDEEQKKADPRKPFLNSYRILTIGVVNHNGRCRIGYRIYVNGMRDLDGEVLKQSFSLQDLYDVIEYVLSLGEELDAISIAMPGVTYHGRLYHPSIGMWGQFISMDIEERFNHIPTILINDVNAMALGYYALNDTSDDMVFYFQPDGTAGAGAGVIIDGKLRMGKMHGAGEIFCIVREAVRDFDRKPFTPEGVLELVTTGLLAYISTIAPKKIVLYSKLTPNPQEIHDALRAKISDQYIPEIVHTPGVKRYILPGAMVHCLEVLENYRVSSDWSAYEKKKK